MEDPKGKVLTLRLPSRTADRLYTAAEVEGTTVSNFVRSMIDERLAELDRDADFHRRLHNHVDRRKQLFGDSETATGAGVNRGRTSRAPR